MQAQLFYAWRIRVLTGNIWLVGAVVLTSLIGGLSGIGTAIAVAMRPQFAGLQRLKVIVTLWLVGAAVCDVIIAAAMIWHLRQKRTGFSRTDHIISRLIHLTMSNGLLTASFALADIIAFLATPRGIHIAFNYTLVKLYGNSVMSSLNSRVILSTSKSKSATSSGHREALGRNGEIGNILTTGQRATQVVVNVETHEMVDVIGTDLKTDVEWNSSDVHSGNSDKNAAVI
ncbi:hypothetical protein AcV5_008427 [Taiwanofungus camphoratus]|nr:hypothetical protein AcV5_008427 [Antrodia cinnamomea]